MLKLLTIATLFQLQLIKMPLPKGNIRDSTKNYVIIHNDGANSNAATTHKVLRKRKLSYHYFISKSGKIYEFVNPKYTAKHAGISLHNGFTMWNSFSIGICLQGKNGTPYSEEQYKSLGVLLSSLYKRYPDAKEKNILTHSEVAFPWGRKTDPGDTFVIEKIKFDSI